MAASGRWCWDGDLREPREVPTRANLLEQVPLDTAMVRTIRDTVERYGDGGGIGEDARRLGISRERVYRALRREDDRETGRMARMIRSMIRVREFAVTVPRELSRDGARPARFCFPADPDRRGIEVPARGGRFS